jgi:glycosyltransferase involved in cell wall biosynthesis
MTQRPRITIVTATLNRRDFLARSVDSVAVQTYPHKEHIVIDGSSTDGTVELLAERAGRYSHLRWISEPDNGLSQAMNKGLARVRGDLIAVLGDDDFYEPGAFDVIAREAERNPKAGIIAGHCHVVNNRAERIDLLRAAWTNRDELIKWWTTWTQTVMLPAPSSFIRSEVIETVGGFDEADRLGMDYHHFIKITERYPVKIVDHVIGNHRWDHGSMSFSQMQETWAWMGRISRKYWGSKRTLAYYKLLLSYIRYWPGRRFRKQIGFFRRTLGRSGGSRGSS